MEKKPIPNWHLSQLSCKSFSCKELTPIWILSVMYMPKMGNLWSTRCCWNQVPLALFPAFRDCGSCSLVIPRDVHRFSTLLGTGGTVAFWGTAVAIRRVLVVLCREEGISLHVKQLCLFCLLSFKTDGSTEISPVCCCAFSSSAAFWKTTLFILVEQWRPKHRSIQSMYWK